MLSHPHPDLPDPADPDADGGQHHLPPRPGENRRRHAAMLIYHMNFGYPLLDEGAKLYLTYQDRFSTSDLASQTVDQIGRVTPPDNGYRARAYNHTVRADAEGYAYASLLNEELQLGATVKFRADTLDKFNLEMPAQAGLRHRPGTLQLPDVGADKPGNTATWSCWNPWRARTFTWNSRSMDGGGGIQGRPLRRLPVR